jgi:hypothetical protein
MIKTDVPAVLCFAHGTILHEFIMTLKLRNKKIIIKNPGADIFISLRTLQ